MVSPVENQMLTQGSWEFILVQCSLLVLASVLVDNHSEIAPNKWFSQFLQIACSDIFMAMLPVGNEGRENGGGGYWKKKEEGRKRERAIFGGKALCNFALVCLGCYDRNTICYMACKLQNFISHGSGGWKSKIKALVRTSFPDGPLFTVTSPLSGASFTKAIHLIHEGSILMTYYLPKAPHADTIQHPGSQDAMQERGRVHKHSIQSKYKVVKCSVW